MKPEIGRTQRARVGGDFLAEINAVATAEIATPFLRGFSERDELPLEKLGERRFACCRAFQALESAVQVFKDCVDGKAGFRCCGKINGHAAGGDLF